MEHCGAKCGARSSSNLVAVDANRVFIVLHIEDVVAAVSVVVQFLVLFLVLFCSIRQRRFGRICTESNIAVCLKFNSLAMAIIIAMTVASLDNVRHVVRSIGRIDDCIPLVK